MTNHWNDLQHADVLMVIGANPAENHPISFRWIQKALDKGATLISVDPRYTRTSQMANIYAQLRSGTDIAFIGGMINYVLQNELYPERLRGRITQMPPTLSQRPIRLTTGSSAATIRKTRSYDKSQWAFETDEERKHKKRSHIAASEMRVSN